MPYSLERERDGAGDSGQMSMGLWEENGELKTEQDAMPRVGIAMRVGSHFARTMSWQDYWTTTYITEILEKNVEGDKKTIKFRTGNSVYTWRAF